MQQPKVLIIYTGGTIGMVNDPSSGTLTAFNFDHLYQQIPEIKRIFEHYTAYDGFVILHGSDTMAYTASALSYMLQGLSKPVILTGSQLPIDEIRTDGRENVLTSIEIAAAKHSDGSSRIKEVAIYFENNLFRGNRTTKISANAFKAFSSPNYPPLATAGIHINYQKRLQNEQQTLQLFTALDNRVALLKIFPGFNASVYQSLFDISKIKGIILETFGAGNAPTDKSFDDLIERYIADGGIVLNQTSSFFQKVGVIGGGDMTTEAAVCKFMYALGNSLSQEEVKKILARNISGELTM